MKKILLIISLLISVACVSQTIPGFTKYYSNVQNNSNAADSFQGIGIDTFVMRGTWKTRPWLAGKGDHLYLWSVGEQKWNRVDGTGGGGGGGGGDGVPDRRGRG